MGQNQGLNTEVINRGLCDIDKKFGIECDGRKDLTDKMAEAQRMADLAMAALSRTKNNYHALATSVLVSSTALNTAAPSWGTGDRNENVQQCLESAGRSLERIQNEDGSAFELVVVTGK